MAKLYDYEKTAPGGNISPNYTAFFVFFDLYT